MMIQMFLAKKENQFVEWFKGAEAASLIPNLLLNPQKLWGLALADAGT
jgi:hypothetical protein